MRGFAARIGQRGAALAAGGCLDVLYGVGLAAGAHGPSATAAAQLLPLRNWGWIFIGIGVCLLARITAEPGRDRLPFTISVLLKTLWAALIVAYGFSHRLPGWWTSGMPWLALAAMMLIAAGNHE